MGIVFERLDKLHLISDHCGIKQCFKNSLSTCLLLLHWKSGSVPALLLGVSGAGYRVLQPPEVPSRFWEGELRKPNLMRCCVPPLNTHRCTTPAPSSEQYLSDLARYKLCHKVAKQQ